MEQLKKRAEMPLETTWKLEDMVNGNEAWETEYAQLDAAIPELARFSGKLSDPDELKNALNEVFHTAWRVEALCAYAAMRKDEDNADPLYQAMYGKAVRQYTTFSEITSYTDPELLSLPEDYLSAQSARPELAEYKVYLDNLQRRRPHTLSTDQERLIAMTGEMAEASGDAYSMMCDADMKFPTIKDADGSDVEITHGRFIKLLESPDRRVREDAWHALLSTYGKWGNTISTMYGGSVKGDIFGARARNFAGSLEASLFETQVPVAVYDNLCKAVRAHLPAMGRYVELRKRLLKVDTVKPCDMYRPMVGDVEMGMGFDEAYKLVIDALGCMGEDYVEQVRAAKSQRWIDVYENEGKTSGAYSNSVWGTHPYVLLNYQQNLDNICTIAHEMGHAMHSWYSDNTQPFATSQYTLFVAEVASTVNELLLMRSLLAKTSDKRTRAYLLNNILEQFRTTVFRQTMFAEFERKAHDFAENNEPFTKDSLCAMYQSLVEDYYPGMDFSGGEDDVKYEWMRIPHFYRAYYVYQYATGFSAAVALSNQILEHGPEQYKKFLRLGGSLPPIDELKVAGVAMDTPEPVEQALAYFEQVLDEFDELTRE